MSFGKGSWTDGQRDGWNGDNIRHNCRNWFAAEVNKIALHEYMFFSWRHITEDALPCSVFV